MMNFSEIKKYAARGSRKLNDNLMDPDKEQCKEIIHIERKLNLELEQITSYSFEELFAHDQMTRIPFNILSIWYKKRINKIIMFPNFLSCSTDKWKNRDTVYRIIPASNSRGRAIFDVVQNKSENEVLFMSKTKFQILEINSEIVLKEYDGTKLDYILYKEVFLEDKEIKDLLNKNIEQSKCKRKSLSDQNEI